MLDFKELGANGRGLEQLVRELLLVLGFQPQWSGEGPDGGKDLIFKEPGMSLLGGKQRTWLVSCKDNSHSGKAVGSDAVNGILEVVAQHHAEAFLLVCSTHPSSGVIDRLSGIETSNRLPCHVWDQVTLETLLNTPSAWPLAQRFMPVSAKAVDWRLFGTDVPNNWVAVHRGQFIRLSSRTGSGMGYDLRSLSARMDEIQNMEDRLGLEMRVREIFHNDTHGAGYSWEVDCLHSRRDPVPDVAAIAAELNRGGAREDGQFHDFEITARSVSRLSDHFDRDHYSYYRKQRR